MLLADYRLYIECQERVSTAYRDRDRWNRMSILNVARMGSSRPIERFGNTARTYGEHGRSRSSPIPEHCRPGRA